MRAIHSFGPRDVRLVTLPDPTPSAGQVVIKILASGICGSDKWFWRNETPTTFIAGHEVAGEIIALGAGVRALRVGDRVAVNNVVSCGRCPACRAGEFVLCPAWDGALDVNGGFAEYVAAPERNCLKLAAEIDPITGAQIFDNFGTPYSAIQHAGIGPRSDVLVSGCGPIGLAAVILAKLQGAYVIASDPLPARRATAAALGADAVLPPGADLPAGVRDLTGGLGAGFVLECSGKSPAYAPSVASLRIGGIFVAVGEGAQYDLHPSDTLIRRHLTMLGSWYSSMQQGQELQNMVLRKQIQPGVLVSHTSNLDNFPALFEQACERPDEVTKAVLTPWP